MGAIDEYRVQMAGGSWGVRDGHYFYPQASEASAVSYAIRHAQEADFLGRIAKVVLERADGTSSTVWQTPGSVVM
jgi:squalene cyclase